MPMGPPARSALASSPATAAAGICDTWTHVGASTGPSRQQARPTSWRICPCTVPRVMRSSARSCEARPSTTVGHVCWVCAPLRTRSCSGSTRPTAGISQRRTALPHARWSSTTAPMSRSWTASTGTGSFRRPTWTPRRIAPSRAGRGSEHLSATTAASSARGGTLGTGATCSASASTSATSPRSRIATCPASARTASTAWSSAPCYSGTPCSSRGTSPAAKPCTMSSPSAPWAPTFCRRW
mmetsp:Transcript_63098/g.176471  ORF Transcript_63098/g.176471 Transcript_63098/m.176471 type:complete len:240 (+) Transcript_63098:1070-1789(+)